MPIDALTKQILGVYIGSRVEMGAKGFWDSLPVVDRLCAVYYTDFWSRSKKNIPQRHKSLGKDTGKTSDMERFNNTLQQRICRLIRKTLFSSISKDIQSCGCLLVFYP
ncbi:IS1 family transposase [Microcoleus sp. LAD1_D1]|uniref:IS1 family transposase n=1 Tax=unclassified Microcoleus TaxID=2642155 RepID=UPI00403F293F